MTQGIPGKIVRYTFSEFDDLGTQNSAMFWNRRSIIFAGEFRTQWFPEIHLFHIVHLLRTFAGTNVHCLHGYEVPNAVIIRLISHIGQGAKCL